MKRLILLVCFLTFAPLTNLMADVAESKSATTPTSKEFRSLDDKIQNLKKEVLGINRELFILEEELLYPANSQVAVFLSMDVGEFFDLDSVQLKIDNKTVTNYLYTKREVEALIRGGIQRLYLGNAKTGNHEIIAIFTGKGPHGRDYRRATTVVFEKGTSMQYIELKIVDSGTKQQPVFAVRKWQ